ncbi:glycosyltransferase [Janthinobacterium fluminis]|uniref:Glycosyltransferase n=1 Tax=Janthinobacterium fluminis TaxID=2987524 RepID=A0ABT5JXI1_9BURK|nr:glycosyltransferase [Janthinobacterium fluminis]MDC8756853.1 glycosyltransferase [Janthinobacterium fluminis]
MASYNGARTLPKVLQAYCRLIAPAGGWSLLVVDNGSDDATATVLGEYGARLPLRYLYEGRRGKNAALNAGVAVALADTVASLFVFTDDDAAPEPDWLLRLSECAAARPDYAVFGGAIVADWAAAPPDWLLRLAPLGLTFGITDPGLADGPVFPGLVWGANMALRRAIFDAGYRFDESLGPNGARAAYAMGSETQLTRRLFGDGYLSWFCPSARVAHHIRARQIEAGYVLRRAYLFGRGKYRQDCGAAGAAAGVPRWMLRRLAQELWGALRARLAGDAEQLFLRRWECAQLRGYLHEAVLYRRRGPPRVLVTSYSGELGGMELRMGQEARLLAGAGYASTLAVRRFPGFDAWADALRAQGVGVAVFDPPPVFEQWRWRRLNKWRARLGAARQLRRHRPDLVHVAFCWHTYGASALWLAHDCGLPCVLSVHNAFPPAEMSAWHRPLLAAAFTSVRGIYAVSDSAMQHFLALYADYIGPATRLAVIPNSVDTQRFVPSAAARAAARTALQLPQQALVLGSVARLAPQKRPEALLRLFCALCGQFPGLRLVLAGAGPLETALRAQAEAAGVAAHVSFTGYCGAVESLMPAFDLHLLLSRNEGFGIATIEAMACGVPVVGTDVPGTADILRGSGAGMLVPLDDEDAAAAAVAALLADPARRADMARLGRSEALATYSDARLRRQVLDFYRGLV